MWVNLFNENKVGDGFIFLVGNKIDLQYREIKPEEAKEKAAKLNVPYVEISAKTGENVEELFFKLIDHTTEKTANSHIFQASEQKEVIKEEGAREEEQKNENGEVNQTGTKLTAINK